VHELEQRRRDLMRDDPALYAYVTARAAAKALDSAGDLASGAVDNYGAANRVWLEAARARARWRAMIGEPG
jgi:hypothetical protein